MLEKGAITGPSDSYYLTMGGGKLCMQAKKRK